MNEDPSAAPPLRTAPTAPAAQAAPPTPAAAALVDEATKKSGLVWLAVPGSAQPARPVWHLWHDGSAYVVTGGIEQPVPGLADAAHVVVIVRSRDNGGRILAWRAEVSRVEPGTPEWHTAVPLLHAKRLNAPDGEAAPQRWARESVVYRLRPIGDLVEDPDHVSAASLAAPPPPTPATTRVPKPFHLGDVRGPRRRVRRKPAT